MILNELFDRYYLDYAQYQCRTAKWMRSNFQRYFIEFGNRLVESIRPLEVNAWHKKLGAKHGQRTANISLTLLRTLYNFGYKWELLDCRNPALAIKKFKEPSRDRIVHPHEMPRLLDAIELHGTKWTKDIFLLCLYTAQRLANVCSMRWEDIDTETAMWTIPASDFKTGVEHKVPLVIEAQAILCRLHANAKTTYVFPGRRDQTKHIDYPYNGWRKILKAAGIKDLNPHDLRRTHATYQADDGVTSVITAKTLGHSNLQTVHKYAKARSEKVRTAMQSAVRRMLET